MVEGIVVCTLDIPHSRWEGSLADHIPHILVLDHTWFVNTFSSISVCIWCTGHSVGDQGCFAPHLADNHLALVDILGKVSTKENRFFSSPLFYAIMCRIVMFMVESFKSFILVVRAVLCFLNEERLAIHRAHNTSRKPEDQVIPVCRVHVNKELKAFKQ